jgi:hypothetical protein
MNLLNRLETKDLWQSAFMLAQGSSLEDIRVNGDSRKEVYFTLTGDNIIRLAREFRSGRAVCNVASLKASMIHLKEEMFKVMRP